MGEVKPEPSGERMVSVRSVREDIEKFRKAMHEGSPLQAGPLAAIDKVLDTLLDCLEVLRDAD